MWGWNQEHYEKDFSQVTVTQQGVIHSHITYPVMYWWHGPYPPPLPTPPTQPRRNSTVKTHSVTAYYPLHLPNCL
jgi:hypothetical protein